MPSRRKDVTAVSLVTRGHELAIAVPQVIGHRVARMALAGPVLSARDHKEFSGMVAEKQVAFMQSWMAMWAHAMQAQQRLALSLWQVCWPTPGGAHPGQTLLQAGEAWQRASLGVIDKGLAPVHRKATANARRLARTRLR